MCLLRGIDQILPHPGDPTLHERYVGDARRYVGLAEQPNGAVPRPVHPTWPWGETLAALADESPDVRILNLETSITRSDRFAAGKAVHYRMSPDNISCLLAARPDVCTLANNHILDLGRAGLEETLEVLTGAGLSYAGAGRDLEEAWRPAVVATAGGGRVLVLSMGARSSGIPPSWAATGDRPGVAALGAPLVQQAPMVLDRIERLRREDDLVHGHSSHHPRPIEIYRDRVIIYGCGDLINDYEGIAGHEAYRGDLPLLSLVDLDRRTGTMVRLRMLPMQAHRLRLRRASAADAERLGSSLEHGTRMSGHRIDVH